MAGSFTPVDLARLAPPSAVESLSFEAILAAMKADLVARDASFTALVESDPAFKILQVCAFREVLLRQRVNEACRAVMLAFATGADLDHIGANYAVARLVIVPADDSTIPPTPAVMESDDEFRARIALSLEGYTTAGSAGSYVYHAMSADGDVKDAGAISPAPGQVTVYVLSRTGTGAPPSTLLATVAAALNADKVRPMTDQVTVQAAAIVEYAIQAELVLDPGPDTSVVLAAAKAAAEKYAKDTHRIGREVARSGIFQALHQPGVVRVSLTQPAADIAVSAGQAAYCTGVVVSLAAGA